MRLQVKKKEKILAGKSSTPDVIPNNTELVTTSAVTQTISTILTSLPSQVRTSQTQTNNSVNRKIQTVQLAVERKFTQTNNKISHHTQSDVVAMSDVMIPAQYDINTTAESQTDFVTYVNDAFAQTETNHQSELKESSSQTIDNISVTVQTYSASMQEFQMQTELMLSTETQTDSNVDDSKISTQKQILPENVINSSYFIESIETQTDPVIIQTEISIDDHVPHLLTMNGILPEDIINTSFFTESFETQTDPVIIISNNDDIPQILTMEQILPEDMINTSFFTESIETQTEPVIIQTKISNHGITNVNNESNISRDMQIVPEVLPSYRTDSILNQETQTDFSKDKIIEETFENIPKISYFQTRSDKKKGYIIKSNYQSLGSVYNFNSSLPLNLNILSSVHTISTQTDNFPASLLPLRPFQGSVLPQVHTSPMATLLTPLGKAWFDCFGLTNYVLFCFLFAYRLKIYARKLHEWKMITNRWFCSSRKWLPKPEVGFGSMGCRVLLKLTFPYRFFLFAFITSVVW